jgi:hypothetical protein
MIPFQPSHPVGRANELQTIQQILARDGDVMVVGVTGSGRRTLIRYGASQIGARVLELDCLRANTSVRFLELLTEGLFELCSTSEERQWLQQWCEARQLPIGEAGLGLNQDKGPSQHPWELFQVLLELPQQFAEQIEGRVVFVFQNFPHIRSWDRTMEWEAYLRDIIRRHSRVSYVILATVAEDWMTQSDVPIVSLVPLTKMDLQAWVEAEMGTHGMKFEPDALDLFLDYVQGHIGDASIYARRIWLDCCASRVETETPLAISIRLEQVHQSILALMEDFSGTFESLLLLLPPIQARVLESLAIDPTDRPHSRDYIQKHQLSRGGGLQGALASLEQKGLIYGPYYGYQIAMPLLRLWLKHRLTG